MESLSHLWHIIKVADKFNLINGNRLTKIKYFDYLSTVQPQFTDTLSDLDFREPWNELKVQLFNR